MKWRPTPRKDRKEKTTYALLADSAGMVKVGATNDLENRLRSIARHCPERLVLIATHPADIERDIHSRIWMHRSHAEWFHANEEVLLLLKRRMRRENRMIDVIDQWQGRRIIPSWESHPSVSEGRP